MLFFFIKSLEVGKVYVFPKFYRWDKPLLDSLLIVTSRTVTSTYRLSKNSARKTLEQDGNQHTPYEKNTWKSHVVHMCLTCGHM